MAKLHLADLSKTCLRHATDKSVSALVTNGHVLDKSKTNQLESSSGFVLDLSKTCPLVASADTDLSVACLRHVLDKSARWSLGIISQRNADML